MSLLVTIWSSLKKAGSLSTTDAADTGQVWIDGSPIYRKVISMGTLPNATTKSVPHGITNLRKLVALYGSADNGAKLFLPLPYATGTWGGAIGISLTDTQVILNTSASDRRVYINSYVILEYVVA